MSLTRARGTSGRRLTVATAVGATLVAILATTETHASPGSIHYACRASQDLTVDRDGSTAHVQLAGRTYDLKRRRSSIGDKYLSSNAALIIDGDSAIFVADDHLDLGTCVKAVPVASSN